MQEKSGQNQPKKINFSEKNEMEKTAMNNSKVSKIVESFEKNIRDYEGDTGLGMRVEKCKVENAFKKLMNSNARGETTPSPGNRRKKKRLGSTKPLGMMNLDSWLKREK